MNSNTVILLYSFCVERREINNLMVAVKIDFGLSVVSSSVKRIITLSRYIVEIYLLLLRSSFLLWMK